MRFRHVKEMLLTKKRKPAPTPPSTPQWPEPKREPAEIA